MVLWPLSDLYPRESVLSRLTISLTLLCFFFYGLCYSPILVFLPFVFFLCGHCCGSLLSYCMWNILCGPYFLLFLATWIDYMSKFIFFLFLATWIDYISMFKFIAFRIFYLSFLLLCLWTLFLIVSLFCCNQNIIMDVMWSFILAWIEKLKKWLS